MFDQGFLGIDTHWRLRVSPLLRENWGNGDEFYAREGEIISLPEKKVDRPSKDAVEFHMDEIFQR